MGPPSSPRIKCCNNLSIRSREPIRLFKKTRRLEVENVVNLATNPYENVVNLATNPCENVVNLATNPRENVVNLATNLVVGELIEEIFHGKQGVCHTMALPFTLRSIMGNSNISPCKNIIFKKSSERNQNPSRYHDSIITNLKFQHKPKYHLSKILV